MPGHQTNLTANLYKTPKQYFTHKCKEFNLNHKVKQSINFNSGGTRESTAVMVLLLIMCDGKMFPLISPPPVKQRGVFNPEELWNFPTDS